MKYQRLFERGQIGCLETKNRIVMPAMGTNLPGCNGEVNEEIIRYYEERAEGGCGLIITEITRVDDETGIGTPCQLCANHIRYIPGLERLARRIHRYDTRIFLQLHHPGRENRSKFIDGRQIAGPSPIMSSAIGEMPREMTTEEVEGMVKKFIIGANIAKAAGMDGVEIHAAHGYLVGSFLSPQSNIRTDKYGGSFENRFRFLAEIVGGIKASCGKKFPVSVRIDGDEFVPGGFGLEDAVKTAAALEQLGVDVINVSAGTYETVNTIIEPTSYPQGWKKHLAAAVKKAVHIPVIACDVIRKPDFAEQLLEEGIQDFVALGRAQLADPQWGNKARAGKEEEIRPCISCLYCIEDVLNGKIIKCAVNARCGRETELTGLSKDGAGRRVVILGGGPAGMEAARVLAIRGFIPVLFEKQPVLGGSARLAAVPPLKEKITWYLEYLEHEIRTLGAEIHLEREPDLEEIKAMEPYAVFSAVGGTNIIPPLPGIQGENVCTVTDILRKRVTVKEKNVVMVGSGMTGLETAEFLAEQKNKVTVIEMLPNIGPGMYTPNLIDIVTRLKKYGVTLIPSCKLCEVTKAGVKAENMKDHTAVEIPADQIVLSLGVKNDPTFSRVLRENFERVCILGDASKVGRIAQAVQAGYEAASDLR
ncbi:NADH:flavin oxidoreductase [Lactonifactor longoviformis]|uniref:2,4-dienoyl-CoA reductase n=1 Tax=Lactonifactor longoviformis DSM 17459 TaxID=1122155 RepID=A0A1M4XP02_9CLOT|nr:FAD-dependent oxidoreductase [Lactonifactor longoviformis]POP33072.1 NADH:flavin oxidoreductase [Lactonifactor longoviformis]SHE95160.1 2,4-dienoyl-CoA reductase [Lactonifactor longoviformis DSM 17459]